MKYLKKFNESKYNTLNEIVNEVLSNPGWKQVEPATEHWNYQLEYKLNDKVKIILLNYDNTGNNMNYYLVSDDQTRLRCWSNNYCYLPTLNEFNFVSSYNRNYTQLYSEYDTIYKNMSNYDRMMKICNYLLPYYERGPDNDTIEDIRECFIEIEDIFNGYSKMIWGYKNQNEEFGFFPAFKFSDRLGLFFEYHYELTDQIIDLFEEGKRKLEYFDIHKSRVDLIEREWGGFVIEILF
jgi:hypothetical protein